MTVPARRRTTADPDTGNPTPSIAVVNGGIDGVVPRWEQVARDHGRFLYTLAYRLTGNDDDAHDLVQEVLLRVRRGLETYQPGSLRAWLSRITTNAYLDLLRHRGRRPTVSLPDDPQYVLPQSKSAEDESATDTLPAHLQEALSKLPDEFRVSVVLSDVFGMSYEQVAEATDVPLGTVRSRIHRGRKLLREMLT